MFTAAVHVQDAAGEYQVHAVTSYENVKAAGQHIVRFYAGDAVLELDIESLTRMARAAGLL